MIYTDDSLVYHQVANRHCAVNNSVKEFANGMVHTNSIESIWTLSQGGYSGICHS